MSDMTELEAENKRLQIENELLYTSLCKTQRTLYARVHEATELYRNEMCKMLEIYSTPCVIKLTTLLEANNLSDILKEKMR